MQLHQLNLAREKAHRPSQSFFMQQMEGTTSNTTVSGCNASEQNQTASTCVLQMQQLETSLHLLLARKAFRAGGGGQGNQAQLRSQQGSSHPAASSCSRWWLLNGAGSPTCSTCASQRPRQHHLWAPGRQKSGSLPEQTSWDTAPRSGATRVLQLHIPIFKQEKLKQRARAGFL